MGIQNSKDKFLFFCFFRVLMNNLQFSHHRIELTGYWLMINTYLRITFSLELKNKSFLYNYLWLYERLYYYMNLLNSYFISRRKSIYIFQINYYCLFNKLFFIHVNPSKKCWEGNTSFKNFQVSRKINLYVIFSKSHEPQRSW